MEIRSCRPRISTVFTGRAFVFPIIMWLQCALPPVVNFLPVWMQPEMERLMSAADGHFSDPKLPLLQISTEKRVTQQVSLESGTWEPIIPLDHRTGVFRKVYGIPHRRFPPFPPIGEMIILTTFTFTTGRKSVSRAIVRMSFSMRRCDLFRNPPKVKSPSCVILPRTPHTVPSGQRKRTERRLRRCLLSLSSITWIIISKSVWLSTWE